MKTPLVMVEFTKDLDDLTDEEFDELAGEIAEAMAANLRVDTSRIQPTD